MRAHKVYRLTYERSDGSTFDGTIEYRSLKKARDIRDGQQVRAVKGELGRTVWCEVIDVETGRIVA